MRGAPRTWNYLKKYTISLFNRLLDMPDWYICLWDSNTTSIDDLQKDFSGSNVKMIKMVDHDLYYEKFNIPVKVALRGHYPPAEPFNKTLECYWSVAYLDQLISIEKRKYELSSNTTYSTVSFIRPDTLIRPALADKRISLNDIDSMDVFGMNPGNKPAKLGVTVEIANKDENYFVSDLGWIAGCNAADIFGTRFFDTFYTDLETPQLHKWDVHQLMGFVQSHYQLYTESTPSYTEKNTAGKFRDGLFSVCIIKPNHLVRKGLDQFIFPLSEKELEILLASYNSELERSRNRLFRTHQPLVGIFDILRDNHNDTKEIWNHLPMWKRNRYCERYNIDKKDYNNTWTPNIGDDEDDPET